MALVATGFNDLAQYVAKSVRDLTGASVTFWMSSKKSGERDSVLRIAASAGEIDPEFVKHATLSTAAMDSLNGYALSIGKTIIKNDIFDPDGRKPSFAYQEVARAHGWHSFMAVPLLGREGEPLGVLSLHSTAIGKFGPPEQQLMQTFANQSAVALQQQRRMEAMYKLAQVGHDLSVNMTAAKELLIQVAQIAKDITKADCTVIYPYDPDKRTFFHKEAVIAVGVQEALTKITDKPRTSGLAEKIRKHQAIIISDLDKDDISLGLMAHTPKSDDENDVVLELAREAKFISREGIKAFIGISLQAHQSGDNPTTEEIGVLYVNFRSPHHFTTEQLQVISIYAQQAANIIRGARLYEQTQRRMRELDALQRSALQIVAQQDIDERLSEIIDAAVSLLRGKGGKIYLKVAGQEQLELVAIRGIDTKMLSPKTRFPTNEGVMGQVFRSRQPLIENDYPRSPYHIPQLSEHFSALIEAPLLLGKEPLGVLAVFDDVEKRSFNKDDLAILERLAQQAALAIHNARLLKQERHLRVQAETLREVSSAISANLDLPSVSGRILDELRKMIAYDRATIQLFHGDAPRELAAYRGWEDGEKADGWLLRPVAEDQLVNRIVQLREPVILGHARKSSYWEILPATAHIGSWVGVPLVYGEKVIGLLTLDHHQPGFYRQEDRTTLMLFAYQAALAVQNAQLYADMEQLAQQRAQALMRERERATAAEKLAVSGKIGARFVHHINNISGAIPVRIALAKENLDKGDPRQAKVITALNTIDAEVRDVLQAAEDIKHSTEIRPAENVDVNRQLQLAVEQVQHIIPNFAKRMSLVKKLDSRLPAIFVDRIGLTDTFSNLIRNGIDAMPAGGTLTLTSSYENTQCTVAITDTGVGISPEDIPRLFDLFFTTKKDGWGFGLWHDKNFIEQLGGDIHVDSVIGVGSTFTITIPTQKL